MNRNTNVSIYLDFDKSLAIYESKWRANKVGTAVPAMLDNVRRWLSKGYKVTIFTARMSHEDPIDNARQLRMINQFLDENNLSGLPITCIKHTHATHFIDDKAYHCVPNTGEILNCPPELL